MIALNHSFVAGIVRRPSDSALAALGLIEHVRRRTSRLPRVHETLATFDTGQGQLVRWANKMRNDVERGPLVELLLRMTSGPFVGADRREGPVEPPVEMLSDWLQDLLRRVLAEPGSSGSPVGGPLWKTPRLILDSKSNRSPGGE